MHEITEWLKHLEEVAHRVYREASVIFEDDRDFSMFLRQLSEDEAEHLDMMSAVSDCLLENEIRVTGSVGIDRDTMAHIARPLEESLSLLRDRRLEKAEMIECMVRAEYSEWNDYFLYVIETLKEHSKRFQQAAASFQAHRNRIEDFIDRLPGEFKPSLDMRRLPDVWRNRFLVVEDDKPILKLLECFLGRMGRVETAGNGLEGLEKLRKHFVDVIISDVDMPVMDGLEMYSRAVKADADVASRFLFFSGGITPEIEAFFQRNSIPYLLKPAMLNDIREAVEKILRQGVQAGRAAGRMQSGRVDAR